MKTEIHRYNHAQKAKPMKTRPAASALSIAEERGEFSRLAIIHTRRNDIERAQRVREMHNDVLTREATG